MNTILHDLKQFLNTSVPISKNIFTQTIEHIYNLQDNSQEIKYLHKLYHSCSNSKTKNIINFRQAWEEYQNKNISTILSIQTLSTQVNKKYKL